MQMTVVPSPRKHKRCKACKREVGYRSDDVVRLHQGHATFGYLHHGCAMAGRITPVRSPNPTPAPAAMVRKPVGASDIQLPAYSGARQSAPVASLTATLLRHLLQGEDRPGGITALGLRELGFEPQDLATVCDSLRQYGVPATVRGQDE
jgi:hypothetical protein